MGTNSVEYRHGTASLLASSRIWVSDVSLAARSRVLARLASLSQIGELARRLWHCAKAHRARVTSKV